MVSQVWRVYTLGMAEETTPDRDDLRAEYDPSTLKAGVRGKYLERYRAGTNLAVLAPDVRAAFPTDEAVNQFLNDFKKWNAPVEEPAPSLHDKHPVNNAAHRSAAK